MFLAIRDHPIIAIYHDLIEGMKDLGVTSFELYLGKQMNTVLGYDLSNNEGVKNLKRFLEENNFTICTILLENDFSLPNLAAEVKYILKAAKVAEVLEVSILRINPPMKKISGYTIRDYIDLSVGAISEILKSNDYVHLAIENHGVIGNNKDYVKGLLECIANERFGVTLDTGNYYWYGYPVKDLYDIYEFVAPRVKHTHIKDATTEHKDKLRKPGEVKMTPIGKGDIDFREILQILKKAGYKGDLTLEDESISIKDPEGSKKSLREDIQFLRALMGELGI